MTHCVIRGEVVGGDCCHSVVTASQRGAQQEAAVAMVTASHCLQWVGSSQGSVCGSVCLFLPFLLMRVIVFP